MYATCLSIHWFLPIHKGKNNESIVEESHHHHNTTKNIESYIERDSSFIFKSPKYFPPFAPQVPTNLPQSPHHRFV